MLIARPAARSAEQRLSNLNLNLALAEEHFIEAMGRHFVTSPNHPELAKAHRKIAVVRAARDAAFRRVIAAEGREA